MTYLILFFVAVVSFFLGRHSVQTFSPKSAAKLDNLRAEAREALSERTQERKEKILEFMEREGRHEKELAVCESEKSSASLNSEKMEKEMKTEKGITRLDVEELLDVSSGTARKYLNELESEGKIVQIGESGPDVYYILKV